MKLISTEFGQALQLMVMEEIRPVTPVYAPDFYGAMMERYRFVTNPLNNIPEAMKTGAKFGIGQANVEGRAITITELGIYNDGIVVSTTDRTDSADVVMTDFIEWATERFGFRRPQTKIPRRFSSSVIVEFETGIEGAINGFGRLSKLGIEAVKAYGQNVELYVKRIGFGTDPLTTHGFAAEFFIEPRAGRPFSEHRYFCGAPLTTDGHIEWLEAFERTLR